MTPPNPMVNFKVDEQALFKVYKIGSLKPLKWEVMEADADADLGSINEHDPLGLDLETTALHGWRQLDADAQATGRAVEGQEKALETLLEIHADDDPLWLYFDSHHTFIMDALTDAYRAAVKEIDCVFFVEDTLKAELQVAVAHLYAKQTDTHIAKSSAEPAWNAIFELVKKNPAAGSGAKRSPTQCRTIAFDIAKLYISLISQLFVLSDLVVMASAEKHRDSATYNPPPRLPLNSHSLCTAYHLQRIFSEVEGCVNEVTALDISSEARNGLASLIDSVKWRFVEILVKEWVRDANMFYHLETWITSWDAASPSTRYLAQYEIYQKHMMTTMYRIATGGDTSPPKTSRHKGIPQALAAKITKAACDSTHAFLDGLILLASEDSLIVRSSALAEGHGSMEMSLHELVDLKDANNRLLDVISNIARFSKLDLPEMITRLESVVGLIFTEEKHTLTAVLQELDDTLFERYTKPRVKVFKALLREAVLDGSIDWYNAPFPTAIRPQIFKILNYVVEFHAHLSCVTPALLEKILSGLISELVLEISRAF